jgi:hypothetical protein
MSGPAVPHNEAAKAAAPVAEINTKRLTRFTRPFVASNKKGAPQAVPPRKWREEAADTAATQDGEDKNDANDAQNNAQDQHQPRVALMVTKADIEALTSKLGPVDVQRALAKQDPIATISTEAASLRTKRFHTETPAEVEAKRSERFANESSNDKKKGPQAPSVTDAVDSDTAAKRSARFGNVTTTATSSTTKNSSSTAELSEAEKKRLSRFG